MIRFLMFLIWKNNWFSYGQMFVIFSYDFLIICDIVVVFDIFSLRISLLLITFGISKVTTKQHNPRQRNLVNMIPFLEFALGRDQRSPPCPGLKHLNANLDHAL